jgi:diguanylate cyclase (GGDEF)-like protein
LAGNEKGAARFWQKRMTIGLKTKASLAIGFALIALAGMGWLSLRENRNVTEADRWVSHTRDVLEANASLRSHLSDAGIARRIFLQGDGKQIEVFDTAAKVSLADFAALRAMTSDNNEQRKRLDRLEPLIHARLAVLQKSIIGHQNGANDESLQKNLSDQFTALVAQFVDQVREFETVEKDLLQKRSTRAEESVRKTSRIDGILGLSVFCFIVVATAGLNRELFRRQQTEQAVAKQKALLQSILDTCSDAIVVSDGSGQIILRNPAAKQLRSEMADRVAADVPQILGFYKPDGTTLFTYEDLPLRRSLQGESVDNLEICVRHPANPAIRWSLASCRPLLGDKAEIIGAVVFYRDITERKELENRLAKYADELKSSNSELQKAQVALQRLASVDELTGLNNRRGFLALAEQSLKLARRTRKPFVLVFVDLDGLKWINDTLGHSQGNRAIADLAFVLTDSFRHSDVLCRLGGDEFAILMVDASEETAGIVRGRLTEKVERLNREGNRPYRFSLSIGMLMCESDEKRTLEDMLEKADALMYQEKKKKSADRGKGHCPHLEPESRDLFRLGVG